MDQREGPRLTRFGATVLTILANRGVRQTNVMIRDMAAKGKHYKRQRVSAWLYGRHPVHHKFPKDLEATYPLSEDERVRLALDFTFGQDERLGETDGVGPGAGPRSVA